MCNMIVKKPEIIRNTGIRHFLDKIIVIEVKKPWMSYFYILFQILFKILNQ